MNLTELAIELFADLIAILLGLTLIIKRFNTSTHLYWGLITISIGIFFSWENINWICVLNQDPDFQYEEILNMDKMLKWFASATIISLFPLASLRPGYLNKKRFLIYLLPYLVLLTISYSFLSTVRHPIKLYSLNELYDKINVFEIKLRLIVFICSIILPVIYFTYPVLMYRSTRKSNIYMYLFLGCNFLLLFIYIWFTLFISIWSFNFLGIFAVLFAIVFSILFYLYDNPLSVYTGKTVEEKSANAGKGDICILIDKYMKQHCPFTDSLFSIEKLATAVQLEHTVINKSIKESGFSNFKEYANIHRLEHFKMIAQQSPDKTIKELMFESGFTSKTTFYRVFSDKYGITPLKYIDSLKNNLE